MDAITLTVGNEPAALPVLQAASTAFLRAAGAEEALCGRIGLVLDEVFTNILEHGYPPDRRERVQAALDVEDGVLTLTLRFQGIPFDVDALRRCAEAAPEDMLADGGRGLG
ncbi:MAG: ATP-binding protein, partial [Desulfovibrionaceae bacterium]